MRPLRGSSTLEALTAMVIVLIAVVGTTMAISSVVVADDAPRTLRGLSWTDELKRGPIEGKMEERGLELHKEVTRKGGRLYHITYRLEVAGGERSIRVLDRYYEKKGAP